MWPAPVTLRGENVVLTPLAQTHAEDLRKVCGEPALQDLWYTSVPTAGGVDAEIDRRLALQAAGSMMPFAVLTPQDRAIGMTTYMNIDAPNRRVEIGSTWYSSTVQRTPVNTEAKRMLLSHAFETLDCIAVEFRTHRLNTRSRRAIERLGAQFDGTLRAHMIMANGTIRDTVCYSVTAPEWPAVRANLDWMLKRPR